MSKEQILALLFAERDKLNHAIEALHRPKRRGPRTVAPAKGKRTLSAAGRMAIAEAARRRWAAIKAGKAPSPFAKRAKHRTPEPKGLRSRSSCLSADLRAAFTSINCCRFRSICSAPVPSGPRGQTKLSFDIGNPASLWNETEASFFTSFWICWQVGMQTGHVIRAANPQIQHWPKTWRGDEEVLWQFWAMRVSKVANMKREATKQL